MESDKIIQNNTNFRVKEMPNDMKSPSLATAATHWEFRWKINACPYFVVLRSGFASIS